MTRPRSKVGLTLAGLYLGASLYLIGTQGLFGESFIAVFLGLPWSYLIVLFRLDNVVREGHPLFYAFLRSQLLAPILLNVVVLYLIGAGISRIMARSAARRAP
ncbi:MAG: hypothetical protein HYZ92_04050 [Candidatus Omnitrophica bacterium]|nr:hypothetical protein [Candidatus Omnitrophota bacterium]